MEPEQSNCAARKREWHSFSIDKTDGSDEGSRLVAFRTNLSFFSYHLARREGGKFDHLPFNSCYLPVWVNVVFDQFHLACQEISCVSLRHTGTPKGNPIVEAFGRLLACSKYRISRGNSARSCDEFVCTRAFVHRIIMF